MATRTRITTTDNVDLMAPGMRTRGAGPSVVYAPPLVSGTTSTPAAVPTGGSLHVVKVSNRHDFVLSVDAIAPDEVLFEYAAPIAFRILAGLAGTQTNARVPATDTYVLSLQKNGVEFGTITFAPGNSDATLAAAEETSFGVDDLLSIIAPSTMDATLAGISITLAAQRIG